MVKNYICYESEDRHFISSIHYNKLSEYLVAEVKIYDKETGEVSEDYTELATNKDEIIALRDYLNSLKLSTRE